MTLSISEAQEYARQLVADLTECAGDQHQIGNLVLEWVEEIVPDGNDFGIVALAALVVIFGECITPHPDRSEIGPDALTIVAPAEVLA